MKRIAIAVMASALSAVAVAGDGVEHPYVGLDYQIGRYKVSDSQNAEPKGVLLHVGSEVIPFLGIEFQAGTGVQDAKVSMPGVNYSISLDQLYGLFLRPQLPLGQHGSVYALAGYSVVGISAKSDNPAFASNSGNDNNFSWGVGADLGVSDSFSVAAEYVEYVKNYKAFNLGVRIPIQ